MTRTMEEWEKEKFRGLKADGTLDRLSADVQRFCAPLWCWRETEGLPEIMNGGTVSFVDTGSVRLAITCFHVINGILTRWRETPGITCQIGDYPLFPDRVAFTFNESADLATFTLDEIAREYFPAPRWPPTPLAAGEALFLGGFPRITRAVLSATNMASDFVSFHGRVSDASLNHATLTLDSKSWFFAGADSVPPHSDYGGMSGGPAFRGDLSLPNGAEMYGIVYNSHIDAELVFVRQLHRITADGHIV